MSLPVSFEFWTPKRGPAGVNWTVGGKCGATMKAAVVLEKAFWLLLRKLAVLALAIASLMPGAPSGGKVAGTGKTGPRGAPVIAKTPSTKPSRSTTATTAAAAWPRIVWISETDSGLKAGSGPPLHSGTSSPQAGGAFFPGCWQPADQEIARRRSARPRADSASARLIE